MTVTNIAEKYITSVRGFSVFLNSGADRPESQEAVIFKEEKVKINYNLDIVNHTNFSGLIQ